MPSPLSRFVFLGAPGVGKGTFASIIAPRLNLRIITAGDLLRKEAQHNPSISSLLTQGFLVPDTVILPLIAKELEKGREGGKEGGYILDGYPRRLTQAQALDGLLEGRGLPPMQRVIHIVLADWVAIAKMLGRVGCPRCHQSFNTTHIVTDTYDMPALLPPSLPSSSSSSSPSSSSSSPSSFPSAFCPGGVTLHECPAVTAAAAGRKGGREGGWTRRSDDTEEIVRRRLEIYREDVQPLLEFYEKEGKLRVFEVFKGVKDAQALERMMLAEE
ncbi:hypothetical protein VYU27_009854 [Nannochloropsis oceanica]